MRIGGRPTDNQLRVLILLLNLAMWVGIIWGAAAIVHELGAMLCQP